MITLKQTLRGLELAGLRFSLSNEPEASVHVYGARGVENALPETGVPILELLGAKVKMFRYGRDTVVWFPVREGFVVISQHNIWWCGLQHHQYSSENAEANSKKAFQEIALEKLKNRRVELSRELTSLREDERKIETIFA